MSANIDADNIPKKIKDIFIKANSDKNVIKSIWTNKEGVATKIYSKENSCILKTGSQINAIIKSTSIKFLKSNNAPASGISTTPISTDEKSVLTWHDSNTNTQYWYPIENNLTIYMNRDSSRMFYMSSLEAIELFDFDTSNVTDMSFMFQGCRSLKTLNLLNFDTSNVIKMNFMFYNTRNLTSLNLSNFNTSNVTTMNSMFFDCVSLAALTLSNLDTSNVTDMGLMLGGCKNLTSLNLSNFDTSNVTDMNSMFYECTKLKSVTYGSKFNNRSLSRPYKIYSNMMYYDCAANKPNWTNGSWDAYGTFCEN